MSGSESWFDFDFFTCCGTSNSQREEEIIQMEIAELSPSNDEERRAAPVLRGDFELNVHDGINLVGASSSHYLVVDLVEGNPFVPMDDPLGFQSDSRTRSRIVTMHVPATADRRAMWEQTFNFFVDNRSNLHLHFRVFGCADGDDDDDEEDECLGEAALPVVFIFRDALASTQQVTPQTPLALKLGPADEKRVHPTAGHRLDAAVHVSWTFSNIFLKYCKKLVRHAHHLNSPRK